MSDFINECFICKQKFTSVVLYSAHRDMRVPLDQRRCIPAAEITKQHLDAERSRYLGTSRR